MTNAEIKDNVLKGGKLAIKRLIDRKRRDNAYIVVSDKGKVVKLKARDIKLQIALLTIVITVSTSADILDLQI